MGGTQGCSGGTPGLLPHGVSPPSALAAASPGGDECLEEDEDELEPGLDEAEAEPEVGSGAKAAGGPRGAVLTRRGITLRVLLRDGLLEPGRGVLSIYYLVSLGTRHGDRGEGTGTGMGQETWDRERDGKQGTQDEDRGCGMRTRDTDGEHGSMMGPREK